MPRVNRQQTEANREAIEVAAARLFRERGLGGVSVADLMAAAGLTHGGFYGHFESKDALAAVACARAFEESTLRWKNRTAAAGHGRAALTTLIDGYLSPRNRAASGTGCPAAALAADVAREPDDAAVRAAFAAGVAVQLDFLAGLLGDASDDAPSAAVDEVRRTALVTMATMVGALALARATRGYPLSDELLAAARAHLCSRLGAPVAENPSGTATGRRAGGRPRPAMR